VPSDPHELLPGLSATVEAHDLPTAHGPLPCWTYVSRGLAPLGQYELVMTLPRRDGNHPEAPLNLFRVVHGLAGAGKIVSAGEYTELGPSGFLGRPSLRGIGYVPALAIEGVEVPDGALAALALLRDELELCKNFGLGRLLARLAEAHDHFPFPPWIDADRPSVVVGGDFEQSVLRHVPRLLVSGARVHKEGQTIELQLPIAGIDQLAPVASMPNDSTLCLFAMPPAAANAVLVWRPGQVAPQACAAPAGDGSRIGGAHCLFVPQQEADGSQLVEDGFAALLNDSSWAQLRRALAEGQPFEVQPQEQDSLSFRLSWY